MSDPELSLIKLSDAIRALVDWDEDLRKAGDFDQADKVWSNIVEMLEFATRIQARTRTGLKAKIACLFAVEIHENCEHEAVSALRKSIESDRQRFEPDDYAP